MLSEETGGGVRVKCALDSEVGGIETVFEETLPDWSHDLKYEIAAAMRLFKFVLVVKAIRQHGFRISGRTIFLLEFVLRAPLSGLFHGASA